MVLWKGRTAARPSSRAPPFSPTPESASARLLRDLTKTGRHRGSGGAPIERPALNEYGRLLGVIAPAAINPSDARSWSYRVGKSLVHGGGEIGFRLIDRAKIFVRQKDGPDREHKAERDGQNRRHDKFESDYFFGHRGYSL
jgi:hypothetical protein